jgi:nitrogen fixation protein NifX
MKIAFTTEDGVHINAHFGWAKQIAVYEVTAEGHEFVENLEFAGDLQEDGNEDKLLPKLEALAGCTIVYVSAIGGSAAARLINRRITPIKAQSETDRILDVLDKMVQTLKGSPPPWLRKALQQQKTQTFEEQEKELV